MSSRSKPAVRPDSSRKDSSEHFEDFSDGAPEECVYSQEQERDVTGSPSQLQQTHQSVESALSTPAGSDRESAGAQHKRPVDLGKPGIAQLGSRAPAPPAIIIESIESSSRETQGTGPMDRNRSSGSLHRIKFPPRPTSASSTSRRQVIQTLDNQLSPQADGPPLHSSQPVQFRAAKRSIAAFNSSAPRMLIKMDVISTTPAPGDYSPLPVPLGREQELLGKRPASAGALRPINKEASGLRLSNSKVPTTFGTSRRFPLKTQRHASPAPGDYSPVIVPVNRTSSVIERKQLRDLYAESSKQAGKPRPTSAGNQSVSSQASGRNRAVGLSPGSNKISLSSIVALHAGTSSVAGRTSPLPSYSVPAGSAFQFARRNSTSQPSHPSQSANTTLASEESSEESVPDTPAVACGNMEVDVVRLQGVRKAGGVAISDPFVKIQAAYRSTAGSGSSTEPLLGAHSHGKTYPVPLGDGNTEFDEAHGSDKHLAFLHPVSSLATWEEYELWLRVDVCEFVDTPGDSVVGTGEVEVMPVFCEHSSTLLPCRTCLQDDSLKNEYICLVKDARKKLCGRVVLSVSCVLLNGPGLPAPQPQSSKSPLTVPSRASPSPVLSNSARLSGSPSPARQPSGGDVLSVIAGIVSTKPSSKSDEKPSISPSATESCPLFAVGEKVFVKPSVNAVWLEGAVATVTLGDKGGPWRYAVTCSDGRTVTDLSSDTIRPFSRPFAVHDVVDVNVVGTDEWRPGVVAVACSDGKYNIRMLSDSTMLTDVHQAYLRHVVYTSPGKSRLTTSPPKLPPPHPRPVLVMETECVSVHVPTGPSGSQRVLAPLQHGSVKPSLSVTTEATSTSIPAAIDSLSSAGNRRTSKVTVALPTGRSGDGHSYGWDIRSPQTQYTADFETPTVMDDDARSPISPEKTQSPGGVSIAPDELEISL